MSTIVNAGAIPVELRERPQWVTWRRELREGKTTKAPWSADGSRRASCDDPATWGAFGVATAAVEARRAAGIGFQITGQDPYVGIDLDHCIDAEGNVEAWAGEILVRLDSYTEVTPSGCGLHIWVRGRLPGDRRRKDGIEMYDRDRYLTVTGDVVQEASQSIEDRQAELEEIYREIFGESEPEPHSNGRRPTLPLDISDQDLLDKAFRARNGGAFRALWEGDRSAFNDDDSAADQSLCNRLAWWTNRDSARIDRLFRQSGLMRAKWERDDYRQSTIDKALASVTEGYEPPAPSPRPRPRPRDDSQAPSAVHPVESAGEYFGEQGFVPARMGQRLQDEGRIRIGIDGRLYRFMDGVYRPDGEPWAASRVREVLGERFRRRHLEEVKSWLRAELASVYPQPDLNILNVKNGLLDWRTGQLQPHDPECVSTLRIPHRWAPDATCPRIDRFLCEVLPEDAVSFVYEIIGYCLYPSNPFHKAVMLIGPQGTGKGTLLRLLTRLLGSDNVAHATLHAIADDRFAAAELQDRLANVCGDLDARTVERSDVFKMVTGGDVLTAQRKYGQPFAFAPFAKLVFSANEFPLSADQTAAYFIRWLPIPMTHQFRGTTEEDTRLDAKLQAGTEVEGLLVRAVSALRTLIDRGRFQIPQSVEDASQQYRQQLDTVLAFISECCQLSSVRWTRRSAIYHAYKQWCGDNGRRPLGSRSVYSRIRESFPAINETTRDGYDGFDGIGLDADPP